MIKTFEPVFDGESRILILGSAPSVKSLEMAFYYGHPQNRFWKLMAEITGEPVPPDVPGRREFLHRNHIALWDVISFCERKGSMDGDIRRAVPVDLARIPNLDRLAVFTNGKLAASLLAKYYPGLPFTALPSTSPANQKYFDREAWLNLRKFLK